MNDWYTSDTHVGHLMVARYRGFATVDAHDRAIASNWNRVVKPQDTVWILGDAGMAREDYILSFFDGLNGRKHLVAGNHDAPWPGHRRAHRHLKTWLTVFDSVQAFATRQIGEHRVMLSHFPYWGDSFAIDDRATQYRLRDEGRWLLHGHTHNKDRLHDGRMIHVGLDAWDMQLVPVGTIAKIIGGTG